MQARSVYWMRRARAAEQAALMAGSGWSGGAVDTGRVDPVVSELSHMLENAIKQLLRTAPPWVDQQTWVHEILTKEDA